MRTTISTPEHHKGTTRDSQSAHLNITTDSHPAQLSMTKDLHPCTHTHHKALTISTPEHRNGLNVDQYEALCNPRRVKGAGEFAQSHQHVCKCKERCITSPPHPRPFAQHPTCVQVQGTVLHPHPSHRPLDG